jgi:hypothetical protein
MSTKFESEVGLEVVKIEVCRFKSELAKTLRNESDFHVSNFHI